MKTYNKVRLGLSRVIITKDDWIHVIYRFIFSTETVLKALLSCTICSEVRYSEPLSKITFTERREGQVPKLLWNVVLGWSPPACIYVHHR